ncbi:ABC transporter ATP-binding protein [Nocardia takedensis]
MTVEVTSQPATETGNRPPNAVGEDDKARARAEKRRQALASKEILAPVRGALTAASAVMALAAICTVTPFILIVAACRELLEPEVDTDAVWRLVWAAVAVLAVRGLLQAGALTWSHLVDAGYQLTVRRALAAKLTRVPLGWFGDRTSTEVKKYLQDDVDALHYLVAHARLEFVGALVVPLVTLGYLFSVEWRLTLVLLVPLVVYAVALSRMMSSEHRERLEVYTGWESRVQESTVEFVDGIQVVRAFGQAGRAHGEYQRAVDGQAEAFERWKTPMIRLQSVADVVITPVFMMLVVVLGGLAGVDLGWLAPLDLLPFLLVGLGLGGSLLGLGFGGQALRTASAAALRLHELQQTPELAAPEHLSPAEAGEPGVVRFESVTFGYREGQQVLRGVDLELRPGTITALVGPSGSGKSTLAKLLPRFYDVTGGRITLDGRDLREFPTAELYRTVGFVFQDVRLIKGTIRDNLRMAATEATQEALETAARAAQIHDRITALPRGYDSEIGVDAMLSGGEAQRLSIARALLADSPVLVLDEATAFADPESEAAVQDALAALVAGRTVLVIAHRLHTITGVDRILVLESGTVVEQGDHESLRAAGGLYSRLWEVNEAALHATLVESEEIR